MPAHNQLQQHLLANPEITDPGNGATIEIDRSPLYIPLTIAASTAETNTLPAPVASGHRLTIMAVSVGGSGSRTITCASALDSSGSTYMQFDAVDELAFLESVGVGSDTYEWRVVNSSGVVID